jgi:rhodanese-related sulfurtransferase
LHRTLAATLAVAILATGAACAEDPASPTIGGPELAARIADASAPVILDVRSEQEFASGHVPGAINVPHDELTARLASLQLASDDEVVVYCESGRRAGAAEDELRRAGFTSVRHLDGDMSAWRRSDLPCQGC